MLKLVVIYSGAFAERVVRNLINDPSFCRPCGLYCDSCKYGAYSHVRNIHAVIELTDPCKLPSFIDNPEEYLPKKIPNVEVCIASGLHKDLLLELPSHLVRAGVKGLIVPIEDFNEVPSGLRSQVQKRCQEMGLESAFPKPFCSLEPKENVPTISKFVFELKIGRPSLELFTAKRGGHELIESSIVHRSAPCGSTWYVAKKLVGTETNKENLYDTIAKAHHSYPCTATMNTDPETQEPLLHVGGYIIREEVEKALKSSRTIDK